MPARVLRGAIGICHRITHVCVAASATDARDSNLNRNWELKRYRESNPESEPLLIASHACMHAAIMPRRRLAADDEMLPPHPLRR